MKNTLILSDLHFPYHHKDTFEFLEAVAWAYDIEDVKSAGDIVDNHSSSYHEIEYGTMSAKEEHDRAKEAVQQLACLFPEMSVVLGNHDVMSYRKAKTAGIPEDHLQSYNDIYGVNWEWKDKDFFKINKDEECLLIHSMGSNTLNNAARHSFNSIQGHHHSKFGIEYFSDANMLRWSMSVGCMIDTHHPAFNYAAKATLNRPVIGLGAIIEDQPTLIPMRLKSNGRWNGRV